MTIIGSEGAGGLGPAELSASLLVAVFRSVISESTVAANIPRGRSPMNVAWVGGGRITFAALTALVLVGLGVARAASAQGRHVPDTFTASTTAMTPAGLTLKIQVQEWSDDEARAAVISALKTAAHPAKALAALPTVGYVWRGDSSVGYSVKYAYREATADGAERITVVTDEPLDTYGSQTWKVADASAKKTYDYSVIELRVDGHGHGAGTTSLAADVVLDDRAHTVSLEHLAATPNVLTDVRREPKPYWAH